MKDKIIHTAITLYRRKGTKHVTLEEVANQLALPEETVLQYVSNEKQLDSEIGKIIFSRIEEIVDGTAKKAENVLENFLLVSFNMINFQHTNPILYSHVINCFAVETTDEKQNRFIKKCRILFEDGVRQGLFEADHNYDTVTLLFENFFYNIKKNCKPVSVIIFFNSICTPAGKELLQEYTQKYKHIINNK